MISSTSHCTTCGSSSSCQSHDLADLSGRWDYVVALAGNPNTGKSTIFNALTGLRQHTGNWPGKTVTRAEGFFTHEGKRFKVVDLPGTYSLLSASADEEVARNFILFGRPQVTVVVVDATRLERNLNLALQILQITDRVVICLNLMDEAKAHGIEIDVKGLEKDLGVPVVPTAARRGKGIEDLKTRMLEVAAGQAACAPRQLEFELPGLGDAIRALAARLQQAFPGIQQAPWISFRLLEGDPRIESAVATGELASLAAVPQGSDNALKRVQFSDAGRL